VSDLKPTSRRRTVAAAIAAGRVYTYGWATQIWQTLVDDEGREIGHEPVGRQAWELLAHKLAEKPTAELPSDRVLLRLTLAGREWRAAHTPVKTIRPSAGVL
jgi:hypothetical protein